MNKLFTKIVGAALGLTMAIGVGVAVGSNSKEATPVHAATSPYTWSNITTDNNYGFPTTASTTESGELTDSSHDNLKFKVKNAQANSGYIFIKSSGYFYNTSAIAGKITNVSATFTNGVSTTAKVKIGLGSSSGSSLTGVTEEKTCSANGTISCDAAESAGYSYFSISETSGKKNAQLASITITFVPTAASDTTTALSVSPDSWTGYDSQTINVSNYTVSCTSTKSPGYEFQGIGSGSGDNFVARVADFTSGLPTTADTRLQWKAKYPTTAGGSTYLYAYVSLTVTADSVQSVAISGSMTKTTYSQGDAWDPAGFTVKAYYASAPSTPVDVTSSATWTYSTTTESTSTTSVTCTASFEGKSATSSAQTVTVNEKQNVGGIVDGEKYFIISTYSNTEYYLKSFSSTLAVSDSAAEWPGDDNMPETDDDAWTFTSTDTDDVWTVTNKDGENLYSIADNNGLRCDENPGTPGLWKLEDDSGIRMHNTKQSAKGQYLTIYQGTNWRTYTSKSGQSNENSIIRFVKYKAPDLLDEELTIAGYTDSFTVGDTFEFGGTATASYTHGDEDVTDDVTFELAGNAISVGDAITASMVGNDVEVGVWYTDAKSNVAAASYTVDISYAAVTSVSITTSTYEMGKVSSFPFGATVLPSNANPNVTWSVAKKSGDISTGFSINSSGVLSVDADAGGILTITATTVGKDSSSASKVATVDVTITGDPVVTVSSALAGYSGKNTNLAYSFSNFTSTLRVVSNDTSKVTVGTPTVTTGSSGSGTVQVNFLAAGSSTLSFKNGDSVVATCTVTVTASAVESVSWTNSSDMTVYSGSTALNASKIASWAPQYTMNNLDSDSITSDYSIQLNGSAYTLGTALTAGTYTVTLTYSGHTTASSNPVVTVIQSLHSISHSESSNYSHTNSTKWSSYSEAQTLSGVSWTPDITWKTTAPGVQNVDGSKGQQIGTKSNSATSMKLSTSGISGTITQIVVNTSGASDISATVSVKVGSTSFTCSDETAPKITATATPYKFIGNASGTIEISWANSSEKAIYLKSISVSSSTTSELANQADHIQAQAKVVEFAQYMNEQMNGTNVCTGDMSNLGTAWSNVSTKYTTLFGTGSSLNVELAYAMNMLADASANWDEDHDSDEQYCLERAMKTYEWCVSKYSGICTPFMSDVRSVEAPHVSPLVNIIGENTNTVAFIVIISVVSVTAIGGYFFYRKRKEI